MMDELKNIISKSATVYSGSLNRFYYNYVPQETSFPYASYFLLLETYEGKDSGNLYGTVRLQFNVFSDYADYGHQCNTITSEILTYFDNDFMNYANASSSVQIISCNRDNLRPAKYIDSKWQATIVYTINILN